MIRTEAQLQLVLEELYKKTCSCIRDDESKEDLLHPTFHEEGCIYKSLVEAQEIEWKKKPTQDS